MRRYLVPGLGQYRLDELSREHIDAFYGVLLTRGSGRGLSTATIRRVHATLMSALSHAVRTGLLASNPAALVDLPASTRPSMRSWSRSELARFLQVAAEDRLYALFLLLAVTGARRGEALGARWTDLSAERSALRIEQQVLVVGARTLIGPPKSAAGRRSVALPPALAHALADHETRQAGERQAAGARWVESGLVFTRLDGTGLNPAAVSRRFQRLGRSAGVPRIRLHDLRHTSASLGLASGETLLEVSRRLGHSSIAITADVYSHVSPAAAAHAAQRLSDYLQMPKLPPT